MADLELEIPTESLWSQKADDLFLESLEELRADDELDNANFVVQRISYPASFDKALIIAGDNPILTHFINNMMNEAEVATHFEAPIFDPENPQPANLYRVCHDLDWGMRELLREMYEWGQVEDEKLEKIVARLCLPATFDYVRTFFQFAKLWTLYDYTIFVKNTRFPPP